MTVGANAAATFVYDDPDRVRKAACKEKWLRKVRSHFQESDFVSRAKRKL
jgi:hypothetical protein